MNNFVEIGIIVYNMPNLLPRALNSLLVQTNKNFDICIVIDGDGIDYSEIINDFISRGLNIRTIISEHIGCGAARQLILDTTKAEYLTYLDADDMLLPHAVDFFYNCKKNNFECVRAKVLRENGDNVSVLNDDTNITWLHGVVYLVDFLRKKDIRFLPLTSEEDGYFNLLVFNTADSVGETDEPIYFVSENPNSITRAGLLDDLNEYTVKYGHNLFISFLTVL